MHPSPSVAVPDQARSAQPHISDFPGLLPSSLRWPRPAPDSPVPPGAKAHAEPAKARREWPPVEAEEADSETERFSSKRSDPDAGEKHKRQHTEDSKDVEADKDEDESTKETDNDKGVDDSSDDGDDDEHNKHNEHTHGKDHKHKLENKKKVRPEPKRTTDPDKESDIAKTDELANKIDKLKHDGSWRTQPKTFAQKTSKTAAQKTDKQNATDIRSDAPMLVNHSLHHHEPGRRPGRGCAFVHLLALLCK